MIEVLIEFISTEFLYLNKLVDFPIVIFYVVQQKRKSSTSSTLVMAEQVLQYRSQLGFSSCLSILVV